MRYLNRIQSIQKKTLEDVPLKKMKILEDELRLSPTLSEDRLLLLSHILRIDRRVIQRFFNTEQDPSLEVIPIQPRAAPPERLVPALQPPAALKSEERLVLAQPPAAPESSKRPLLVPCLRIPRCCVPQKRPADGANSVEGNFTPEPGTTLRQRHAGGDSSDRHEANCVACRFGTIVFRGAADDESDNSRPTTPSEEVPEAVPTMEPAPDRGGVEKASEEAETNPVSSPKLNITISLQSQLFEEYKKSPILDTDRLNLLRSQLNLSQRRITAYFSRLSSLIRGKTKNDFAKLLSPYPKSFLLKIGARYCRSHHLTWVQRQKLARKLGSSTTVITDWFYNARLYELVSGSPFILHVKPSRATSSQVQRFPKKSLPLFCRNAASSQVQQFPKESLSSILQNHPANSPMHVDALKAKRLVEEYRRDPNMTKERLGALADELQVGQSDLRIWFEVNFPSGVEEADTETGAEEATSGSCESSLPEALFDAFKKSSHASPATLAQLSSTFNMSPAQIHKTRKWFVQTRHTLRSVASKTPIFEYEYRNKYLKPENIRILEYEFQKHPYESIKLRDALSKELQVKKATIEGWFRNRRYFELILCGMPELFDAWKRNENAEDSDCQVLEIPPVAAKEAASFEQAKPHFEERSSTTDVSEVCALPNAPEPDTEFVFVSCTPSEIKEESSFPKIEVIENASDNAPENSFTSVSPVFLEPLVTVEEVKSPLEGQLPRYSFMSNRPNSRVTMIRRCSPSVDERLGPIAESIGAGSSENISAELSDTFESLPIASWNHSKFPAGKPLDDSNFATDVEEKLADSPHPLDVSPLMPLEVLANVKPGIEDPLTSPMPNEPTQEPNPRFNEPKSETTQLSSFQIEILKKRFAVSPRVNAANLQQLASALALSEKQILEFGFEKKRPKSALSPFQSFVLEREFAANRELTQDLEEDLCRRLMISNASIKAWFEKRRRSGNSEM